MRSFRTAASISGVEFLLFLAGWLVVTAMVGVVVRSTTDRGARAGRRGDATAHLPRCAHCEYIVHALPSHTCPECGRDLRRGGIN